MTEKKIVFSGIQPTGDMHLGNYIGAVKNWVSLQDNINYQCIYSIVDLHALTLYQQPDILRNSVYKTLALLLACGIDAQRSIVFVQSHNYHHAELAWIINCIARIGWLNRMTQFKDKAGKNKEKSSTGLYIYPNLQAADVLLYQTNLVPIGEDQKQHLELIKDIANKFNYQYNQDIFIVPEIMTNKHCARIMSLKDATKKMSKSDTNVNSKILLTDDNDTIANKIAKAKTDSGKMPTINEDISTRLEIINLLNIYTFFANTTTESVISRYEGQNFVLFKADLTELLIQSLFNIRIKYIDLLDNKEYIKDILLKGQDQAMELSNSFLQQVKQVIGLI